jgi:hypothetical protein
MPIELSDHTAVFCDVVGVEEAESLLEWLGNRPQARIDLSACSHLHPANLQVLMAAATPIAAWPVDDLLRAWLESALAAQ